MANDAALPPPCRRWLARSAAAGAILLAVASSAPARAQGGPETVAIWLPPTVRLAPLGTEVERARQTLRFTGARLQAGHVLRVSVAAVAAGDFPVERTAFTTSAGAGGTGLTGWLSGGWTPVFESLPGATAGEATIEWRLAARPGELGAGEHRITLQWRLEAVPAAGPGGSAGPPSNVPAPGPAARTPWPELPTAAAAEAPPPGQRRPTRSPN